MRIPRVMDGESQRREIPLRLSWGLALIVPMLLMSCRVTPHSVAQSRKDHDYQRLEIIYQAHPAEAVSLVTPPVHAPTIPTAREIVMVSAESPVAMPSQVEPICSVAELRIEYPHPDGRPDYARVTLGFKSSECGRQCERLTLEARTEMQRERREVRRERWFGSREQADAGGMTLAELDLPRGELDAILQELESHAFFTREPTGDNGESKLEVRLNRAWTSKSWHYEPTLDALTMRVYKEGRLRTVSDSETSRLSWWKGWVPVTLPGRVR